MVTMFPIGYYVFLTNTFEKGLLRNASQDDSTPFTTPVNHYSSLA